MQSIVSLKAVTVKYGSYTAVENANLEIFDNDFIAIIGPNGGGKTSLVKAILGQVDYSGEIELSPTLISDKKRLIGYLPQQATFDKQFPISVIEVILSGLQCKKGLWGRYKQSDREKALQLLDYMGIINIANKQIGEISGGQMQRALLCRAIISEPKLLILDEPTNFVDKQFESRLYDILSDLNHRMAIVMVSHDVKRVSNAVKSIVCINRTLHRHNSNTLTNSELEEYCGVKR